MPRRIVSLLLLGLLGCEAPATQAPPAAEAPDCASVVARYEEALSAARGCAQDSDCQALAGPCALGLGSCYEFGNADLSRDALVSLGLEFERLGCQGAACQCAGGAPAARCSAGACVSAERCGGRDPGAVWLEADGCTTCACTAQGARCNDAACQDFCADLPLCPPPCPAAAPQNTACEPWEPACGDLAGLRCRCQEGAWACDRVDPPLDGCPDTCAPAPAPTCDALAARYDDALRRHSACLGDGDCRALVGQCGVGLGGCYAFANQGLLQGELSALGQQWFEGACGGDTCDACGAQPPALCLQGRCQEGEFCPGRALGERWTADDGCNTCVCAADGPLCTLDPCPIEPDADDLEPQDMPPEELPPEDAVDLPDAPPDLPVEDTPDLIDPCQSIADDYRQLVDQYSACGQDSDCAWRYGQCGLGLGSCYEPVRAELPQQALAALGARWFRAGCGGELCNDCDAPPPVRCQDGLCALDIDCGDHQMGESWVREDGCTRCSCTRSGEVCDASLCPTACELIEREYNARVEAASTCEQDTDCRVLVSHCGAGACYTYANQGLTQAELDALTFRYLEARCADIFCHCELPFEVSCQSGLCKPATPE